MLACYLVACEGLSAEEAIVETRERRPLSINTKTQEDAVYEYALSMKDIAII